MLKMLTMLDEYSRRCLATRVERQIQSEHVLTTLWQATTMYGIPRYIRSDNGSNLSHRRFKHGLAKTKLKHATLIPVVLGRMVILKVFTAVFATNV